MFSAKSLNIQKSIFATISEMAKKYNAIDLSQGVPEFDCDPDLVELLHEAVIEGHNQYAPVAGVLDLRKRVVEKIKDKYGYSYDVETEVTITAGATQALYTTFSTFIQEGDEVIVFEPAYDSYAPVIKLNGGNPVFVQLRKPDFKIDWEEVKKAINTRTRMIVINTPHNPTGTIFGEEDIKRLSKIIIGSNIIIVSDEVYEHIVFGGITHQSVCRFPDLAKRSIVISSFGKLLHITGWKLGYCVAPKRLMSEFQKIHQYNVFSVNTAEQYAVARHLKNNNVYDEIGPFYEKKRDYLANLLKETRFKVLPADGTFFLNVDYSAISNERDYDFAVGLIKKNGVATIPFSSFYHQKIDQKILRLCFAKKDETLKKAADILKKI